MKIRFKVVRILPFHPRAMDDKTKPYDAYTKTINMNILNDKIRNSYDAYDGN
jgi:hypothetical protein